MPSAEREVVHAFGRTWQVVSSYRQTYAKVIVEGKRTRYEPYSFMVEVWREIDGRAVE